MLARQSGGDNGLLASPGSCYTAGDTQAALYLAAALSSVSSDCNGARGHFLSPHNKSLKEQIAQEEMNIQALILPLTSVRLLLYLFTIKSTWTGEHKAAKEPASLFFLNEALS